MDVANSVDPSNAAQSESWDGPGGAYWTENADRFDDGVAGYRAAFTEAADVRDDSTVLDIGCGAGQTTRDMARAAPAGTALGVDLSAEMIALARARAERDGLSNAHFQRADAQVHPFEAGGVDIAVSRHGSMFFGDPVAAFTNIGRALRPGGRLVLLTWQPFECQEWLSTFLTTLAGGGPAPAPPSDAPSPLALGDPDRIRSVLAPAGFVDVSVDGLREPMYFGADADDALRFVTGLFSGLLDQHDAERRARVVAELRDSMTDHLGERGVVYESAAWLVRAHRR